MSMRFPLLLGATLAALVAASPVVAQDGSPSPSVASSMVPAAPSSAASPVPVLPDSTPVTAGPRLRQVVSPLLRRSGMLDHLVTLGDELLALAPTTNENGQTVIRVLVTRGGARWSRRGRIPVTGDVSDMVADGPTLYAVGWDEGATIWRSGDAGRTWAVPSDQAPFAGDADGQAGTVEDADIAAIAVGPAGLLAVGQATNPDIRQRRAAAWRSADGLAWERLADVSSLPPFHSIAADEATYVVVGSSSTAATPLRGTDTPVLRWSTDGTTWTDASIDVGPMEWVDGVVAMPGSGFLAWGRYLDTADLPAITWTSTDGRAWIRSAPDPSLGRARLAQVRVLEGGALVMGVGGVPNGAWSFTFTDGGWRRSVMRATSRACARDVASNSAILVAVGGTCGAPRQRGRAWTAPLEP